MTTLSEGPPVEHVATPHARPTWAPGEELVVRWPGNKDDGQRVRVHEDVLVERADGTTRRMPRERLERP